MPRSDKPRPRAPPALAVRLLALQRALRRPGGVHRAQRRLEHRSSDVAEHVVEELSALHWRLLEALPDRPRRAWRLYRDVQRLVLTLALQAVDPPSMRS